MLSRSSEQELDFTWVEKEIDKKEKSPIMGFFLFAVREGFEPSVQFNPYGSLANYWFEPLTHLTVPALFREGCKNRW